MSNFIRNYSRKGALNFCCTLESPGELMIGSLLPEILVNWSKVSHRGFPGGSVIKNLLVNAGDTGNAVTIPGSGRSPGEGNVNPLQHPCLENPMERGAWWATVHRVTKSWT